MGRRTNRTFDRFGDVPFWQKLRTFIGLVRILPVEGGSGTGR